MKLVTYFPDSIGLSLRESAIHIHETSKTLSIKQLKQRLANPGFYQWRLADNSQPVFESAAVFLTSDASYERSRLPSQLTAQVFPNILMPLVKQELLCEVNVVATVLVERIPVQKVQYLLQIYKNGWKDEIIDIHSSAQGEVSVINPFTELDAVLKNLAACLVKNKQK